MRVEKELRGSPLHVLVCGGAGSGKSSLIGRLAYELVAPQADRRKPSGSIDQDELVNQVESLAIRHLMSMGVEVAGRECRTEDRDFTLTDAPGEPAAFRDMVAAASLSDLALVVVDADAGLDASSRLHSLVLGLLGIGQVTLVINKMDRVGFDQARFDEILEDYLDFARAIGLDGIVGIPVSAPRGDNVARGSSTMPWYRGPSLVEVLDGAKVDRGDIVAAADDPAEVTDQVMAHVIWMSEQPLLPERPYDLILGVETVPAAITELKHKINVENLDQLAAKTLQMNEIGVCNIALDKPVAYSPYADNPALGGFLLLDRISKETLGAGMIDFGLRRATNLSWQDYDIGKRTRAAQKRQTPCVLWFTGLSGAGKSTVADLVDKKLHTMGQHCYVLDGDNVRHGLNKDLGFTDADRVENIRRIAETARLFVDAGLIVLVSFISPFRSERRMARALVEEGEFIEIFIDTPLAVCEERDPKGLYRKARSGQIANFTGIDSPYEPPEAAEVRLNTAELSEEEAAAAVIDFMRERGLV